MVSRGGGGNALSVSLSLLSCLLAAFRVRADGSDAAPGAAATSTAAVPGVGGRAAPTGVSALAAASARAGDSQAATARHAAAVAARIDNTQPISVRDCLAQPREHLLDRYRDRINLNQLDRAAESAPRHTGRDDRATVEQVMDPRTRLILFKLLSSNVISEINGCISTGKEANVYHAVRPGGAAAAIKIYKTSILVFKDRDRYVSGEYRFRSGYSRSNPRKMVRLWAEKETRNLKRMHTAGLPVPEPLLLRSHLLMMDFLGEDGWPSPRLRDAALSASKLADAYMEVVDIMRSMYHRCRLVHADLSEYNMLWHKGHIVVIDVSQSVEHDHPRALEFLRMDAQNVTDFFRRSGVRTMLPRELFDYVVHASLPDREAEQAYLDEMAAREEGRAEAAAAGGAAAAAGDAAQAVDHAVFMQAYIPQSLAAVRDAEEETARLVAGDTSGMYYRALTGLDEAQPAAAVRHAPTAGAIVQPTGSPAGPDTTPVAGRVRFADQSVSGSAAPAASAGSAEAARDQSPDSDLSDSDTESGSAGGGAEGAVGPGGVFVHYRGMSKEEKKAHKAAVKEGNRERRKTKLSKKAKKRAVKATSTARH
jgi:RIO kinase 1